MKSQDIISISQSCKNYLEQQLEERKKWKVFWLRSCCKIKNLQVSKFNSFSPLRAWLCAPPAPPAADWELRAWEVERWRGGEVGPTSTSSNRLDNYKPAERCWAVLDWEHQRHPDILTIAIQLRGGGPSVRLDELDLTITSQSQNHGTDVILTTSKPRSVIKPSITSHLCILTNRKWS